jgi:ABC-2 type transport system ATP-binding protein
VSPAAAPSADGRRAPGGPPAPAIETEALGRDFTPRRHGRRGRDGARPGTIRALDGLSLAIPAGEVHGLLGPNGAGKTTLVKILATVLLPTRGHARVLGHDVVADTGAVRRLVGIVFGGELGLYTRLSPRQNLAYWAALHRLPRRLARDRVDALLDRVGLGGRADDPVQTLSRGMKQRLHLARGLISEPPVLFLDEPTTGMDPVAALEFRSLVDGLRSEGRTVLLATHDMTEAELLCDRVSLIDRGRLLATESPRTLGTWITRFERIDVRGAGGELLDRLRELEGVGRITAARDGSVRIHTTAEGAAAEALRLLVAGGVSSITTSLPSLEDVYLHVIGERGMEL